ncbi:hypothetical protein MZD04_gp278 [Pseudomonas phage Psa21]|uniref:Uncharacterized protein n=1 Tax=Pseudomonas phage Psa21 TaxID=2530023 RepID=A0A481W601_9CAUD|nr:hypothetical protein MZD04_gp278 [Pseudomonas phage Psa21]QBJ02804.1 hypothetical protein PSA21_278 [Pseudomonas phage Psa21]
MQVSMGETILHTVTLAYGPVNGVSILRTTPEEAEVVAGWLRDGSIVCDIKQSGFCINDTLFTKVISGESIENIFVAYITWYDECPFPFFTPKDYCESAFFDTSKSHIGLRQYCFQNDQLHMFDADFLELMHAHRRNITKRADADPSIPDELDVEMDEQWRVANSSIKPDQWPSFMPGGVYNKELHRQNCEELAQLYPNVEILRLPDLFKRNGEIDEVSLQKKRANLHQALQRNVNDTTWLAGLFASFRGAISSVAKMKDVANAIDVKMREAHEMALTPTERCRQLDVRTSRIKLIDCYATQIFAAKPRMSPYTNTDINALLWLLSEIRHNDEFFKGIPITKTVLPYIGKVLHDLEIYVQKDIFDVAPELSPKETLDTLVLRYIAMINVNTDKGFDWTVDYYGEYTNLNHLLWMLKEVQENPEQSHTKKHRWIGFVQSQLVAYKFTTVNYERNATRWILDGQ